MKPKKRAIPSASYARVRRAVFQVDDLEPAPYNARSISHEALAGLTASLEQFGVLAPPIVNVAHTPPRIVGGHQRVLALKEAGVAEVECITVEFDEVLERRANFALNNPHIEGTFVPGLTRALLEEIASSLPNADALLKSLRLDSLLKQVIRDAEHSLADKSVKEGHIDDEEMPPFPKSKPVSESGRIYRLGDHLLYCGRLVEPGDLKAFGVKAANMGLTSLFHSSLLSNDAITVALTHTLQNVDGAIYVATDLRNLPGVHAQFQASGGHWSNTLIAYSDGGSSAKEGYRPVTLPMVYGWRAGQAHGFYGGRDQGNVWKMPKKVDVSRLQVDIAQRAILNSSTVGHRVLDVNVGDGSTLIAAEKTGRRLIGLVATPREADRVRARWTKFTKGPGANWRAATEAV